MDEFLWDGEYEAKEIDPDVNADLAASFLEAQTRFSQAAEPLAICNLSRDFRR